MASTSRIISPDDLVTAKFDAAADDWAERRGITTEEVSNDLQDGVWKKLPSMPRLWVKGTGTITVEVRDVAGVVTTSPDWVFTSNGLNRDIRYPYFGEMADSIRASFTGTAAATLL